MMQKAAGFATALVWIVVAGCVAQQGQDSAFRSETSATGAESADRVRARIHTELAGGYFELGNMGVAIEEVKEALRSDANYGPAHNVSGLIYSALKEDRLAEESFRRALQLNPLDPDANHNYGQFLCQHKREEEGIRYFLAAVKNPLYQSPGRSYTNAGICARRRGDSANATNYFQLALKTQPGQPQALYHSADLAFARGDYAAAKVYLNRLTQVSVANAEILWLGVRVERRLGDRNSEASYAMQLKNKFPDSKEARLLASGEN
jgi:type IV pilus assembly protein PilF